MKLKGKMGKYRGKYNFIALCGRGLGRGGKKAAFTIAEVLITIGIIGVVAAISLPTLLTNVQEKVTVHKLETVYSKLNSAFKMMIEEDGEFTNNRSASQRELDIYDNLPKFLKVANKCYGAPCSIYVSGAKTKYLDGSPYGGGGYISYHNFILPDSTWVAVLGIGQCNNDVDFHNPAGRGSYDGLCARIFVDLNGKKGPNKFGVDTFIFHLMTNGLIPIGGKKEIIWMNQYSQNCPIKSGHSGGYACTAWVLQNKNMNYLHQK